MVTMEPIRYYGQGQVATMEPLIRNYGQGQLVHTQGSYPEQSPDYHSMLAEAFYSTLNHQQTDQELTNWLKNI